MRSLSWSMPMPPSPARHAHSSFSSCVRPSLRHFLQSACSRSKGSTRKKKNPSDQEIRTGIMIATGVPFSAYRRSRKIDAKTAITKAICHICTAAPVARSRSAQPQLPAARSEGGTTGRVIARPNVGTRVEMRVSPHPKQPTSRPYKHSCQHATPRPHLRATYIEVPCRSSINAQPAAAPCRVYVPPCSKRGAVLLFPPLANWPRKATRETRV